MGRKKLVEQKKYQAKIEKKLNAIEVTGFDTIRNKKSNKYLKKQKKYFKLKAEKIKIEKVKIPKIKIKMPVKGKHVLQLTKKNRGFYNALVKVVGEDELKKYIKYNEDLDKLADQINDFHDFFYEGQTDQDDIFTDEELMYRPSRAKANVLKMLQNL